MNHLDMKCLSTSQLAHMLAGNSLPDKTKAVKNPPVTMLWLVSIRTTLKTKKIVTPQKSNTCNTDIVCKCGPTCQM